MNERTNERTNVRTYGRERLIVRAREKNTPPPFSRSSLSLSLSLSLSSLFRAFYGVSKSFLLLFLRIVVRARRMKKECTLFLLCGTFRKSVKKNVLKKMWVSHHHVVSLFISLSLSLSVSLSLFAHRGKSMPNK